jgi:hypothetical protein
LPKPKGLREENLSFLNNSAGGLLVPDGIIHPVVSVSALTLFIRYIYYKPLFVLLYFSLGHCVVSFSLIYGFCLPKPKGLREEKLSFLDNYIITPLKTGGI